MLCMQQISHLGQSCKHFFPLKNHQSVQLISIEASYNSIMPFVSHWQKWQLSISKCFYWWCVNNEHDYHFGHCQLSWVLSKTFKNWICFYHQKQGENDSYSGALGMAIMTSSNWLNKVEMFPPAYLEMERDPVSKTLYLKNLWWWKRPVSKMFEKTCDDGQTNYHIYSNYRITGSFYSQFGLGFLQDDSLPLQPSAWKDWRRPQTAHPAMASYTRYLSDTCESLYKQTIWLTVISNLKTRQYI